MSDVLKATYDSVEYLCVPFASEAELRALCLDGHAKEQGHLLYSKVWCRIASVQAPCNAWDTYLRPVPRPSNFADAREGLAHLLGEGAKCVGPLGGIARLTEDGTRLSADGAIVVLDAVDWRRLRPYCPVWDAPAPTEEELRASANLVILTGSLDDPLRSDDGVSAGELEVLGPIRALISSAGLQGSVAAFALPGQQRLAAAYRYLAERRSVFCLTALYEPFGLAPLEAAAAGLPLVVTRNGGPSESLVEGDTEYGVLVDPADAASVAAGLNRALGPEWPALAAAGRQRVLDRYTWDRTAEGYLAAIARAAAAQERPRLAIPDWFDQPGTTDAFGPKDLARLYLG